VGEHNFNYYYYYYYYYYLITGAISSQLIHIPNQCLKNMFPYNSPYPVNYGIDNMDRANCTKL